LRHLDLLIHTIKDTYKSTTERFTELLADGMITYNLLWILFKSNSHIFTICRASRKPRCLKYDFGEEKKTTQGIKYFELQYRSLDFDGNVFGRVTEKLIIEKFRGAKRIDALDVFPLKHHPTPKKIKKHLTARSRKFVSIKDSDHFYYESNAFFEKPKELIRIPVKSRIMIDADLFRKTNPSYPRLFTKKSDGIAVDLNL
jgi:hypothetical protein